LTGYQLITSTEIGAVFLMSTFGFKIQQFFAKFGLGITSHSELERLQSLEDNQAQYDLKYLFSFEQNSAGELLQWLPFSKSQLRQDLFVLCATEYKKDGFFVEFGAADGKHLSNSYLLETKFGWSGILAEPAKVWHNKILKNRPKTILEKNCVWSETGLNLVFRETENAELSTLSDYATNDEHKENRENALEYKVNTISLNDLLGKYDTPSRPDYLSIDTEGSEYEILKSLDFSKYKFTVITCEHNYGKQRQNIFDLLTSHGYVRVLENLSNFDDWYVLSTELKGLQKSIR
jgi:FkbM family methyltransferase